MNSENIGTAVGLQKWSDGMVAELEHRRGAGCDDVPLDIIDIVLSFSDSHANFTETQNLLEKILAGWGTDEHLARYTDPRLLLKIGTLHRRCAHSDEEVAWLQKAYMWATILLETDAPLVIQAAEQLSCVLPMAGRPEEANRLSQRVLAYRRKTGGENSYGTFWPLMNQAHNRFETGEDEEALRLMEEAMAVWLKNPRMSAPGCSSVIDCMSSFVIEENPVFSDRAADLLNAAMDQMEPAFTAMGTREAADVLVSMAENTDDAGKAVIRYAAALDIMEDLYGRNDLQNLEILEGIGCRLHEEQKYAEAIPYLERHATGVRQRPGYRALSHSNTLCTLAACYEQVGASDRAGELRAQVEAALASATRR
jgi:tetratricopeptide (TPR) repeat protein